MKNRLFLTMVLLAIATSTRVFAATGGIDWMYDYSTGLERARIERKPVMIDFYTLWCHYCKVLDAKTYTDPSVIGSAKDFVCLKINAERERQLARQFRISAYPIIVFLSRDGIEIKRIYGYVTAAVLDAALDGILNDKGTLDARAEKHKKNPGDVEMGYLYADELMAKGQFKEATKILEKIVRDPSQKRKADATLNLAVCRFKQGSYESAVSELAKFSSRFKSSERIDEAQLFYGLSLLASGQRGKGVDVLKRLQERASAKWVGQEALRQLTLAREGKG
ncbi:MAG: thioredoxin family protein [Candidatus Eisenbacteria bacterium]|nr:thioredoxin family protein [Candidatus Eisenbacteria bacterium]